MLNRRAVATRFWTARGNHCATSTAPQSESLNQTLRLCLLAVPLQLPILRTLCKLQDYVLSVLHPRSLQRVLRIGQDMSLHGDEFEETLSELLLGQKSQVPHFGVFRRLQSFSRTSRKRNIYLKHWKKRGTTKIRSLQSGPPSCNLVYILYPIIDISTITDKKSHQFHSN